MNAISFPQPVAIAPAAFTRRPVRAASLSRLQSRKSPGLLPADVWLASTYDIT